MGVLLEGVELAKTPDLRQHTERRSCILEWAVRSVVSQGPLSDSERQL